MSSLGYEKRLIDITTADGIAEVQAGLYGQDQWDNFAHGEAVVRPNDTGLVKIVLPLAQLHGYQVDAERLDEQSKVRLYDPQSKTFVSVQLPTMKYY